jgi:hypothetical protein
MAEPLKATFFTLKHRDRAVLLPATMVMIVIVGLIVATWLWLNLGTLSHIVETFKQMPIGATEAPDQVDETQMVNLITGIMGMFVSTVLLLIPFYIAMASYEAACLRWMIRGEAPGLFGTTIDNDVWRVWGVYWCWLIAGLAVGMIASVLMIPVMFTMIGDMAAQGPEPDPEVMWELQIKMHALSLIQYVPMAFIGIRLGPAAATSVARQRFSFFEAWEVTRDRFWALFGAYAFWVLVFALLWVAPMIVSFFVDYGGSWEAYSQAWTQIPTPQQTEEMWASLFTQTSLLWMAVNVVLGAVIGICWALFSYGINARAVLAALEEEKITPAPAS